MKIRKGSTVKLLPFEEAALLDMPPYVRNVRDSIYGIDKEIWNKYAGKEYKVTQVFNDQTIQVQGNNYFWPIPGVVKVNKFSLKRFLEGLLGWVVLFTLAYLATAAFASTI